MIKRGWVTPILVSIICIVMLLSYQSKQLGQSHARHSNLPQIPWEKERNEILELHIASGSQTISIKRGTDAWMMTSPVTSYVDATYLYDALSFVLKPPISSTIASPVTDVKSFGIDAYSKSVSIIDNDGKKYELICGSEADSSSYYAYEPLSHTIYTIDKNAFDKMSTVVDDWREKRYIQYDANTLATIKLKVGPQEHLITKTLIEEKQVWTSSTLSETFVTELQGFLKTTRISQFIVDGASPEIVKSYGFDEPSFSLVLIDAQGSKQIFDFKLGQANSKSCYVLDRNSRNIYTIPYFELHRLKTT
ncbi:MAG: DUF4340 domain-containing protein [Cellulosilyticaceae bacterium]